MHKIIPHVKPKYLLLIAGIVRMFAGANILRIGIPDFNLYWKYCGIGTSLIGESILFLQKFIAAINNMRN